MKAIVFTLFFVGVLNPVWACDTHSADIIGAAKSDDGKFSYCEYHYVNPSQTKVDYRLLDGSLIASKTIDYSKSQVAPDVDQRDKRSGEWRSVVKQGDSYQLFYQKASGENIETNKVTVKENAIVDAGFDPLIRQEWQSLIDGSKSTFEFVSPVHGKAVTLQVVKPSSDTQCGPHPYDKDSQLCLTIKVNNLLIRAFADPLYLTYDRNSKRLVRFSGVVNINDNEANDVSATIDYRYTSG